MKLQCTRFLFISKIILVGFAMCLALTLNVRGIDASHKFDFDGDGKTDISVYRTGGIITPPPLPAYFYVLSSQTGELITFQWGRTYDSPIIADYDNDGKSDFAIKQYQDVGEPDLHWINYSGGGQSVISFGNEGSVVSRNYIDDGKADIAYFKEYDVSENPQKPCSISAFFVRVAISNTDLRKDVINTCTNGYFKNYPAPGDYNNDGKSDVAALIVPTSNPGASYFVAWYSPFVPFEYTTPDITQSLDVEVPAPGDYDGDGKDDFAGIKIVNGTRLWRIKRSSNGSLIELTFGFNTDKPVPGDYDGDGKTDIGVFRPSNSTWYILRSSDNSIISEVFGISSDTPLMLLPHSNFLIF